MKTRDKLALGLLTGAGALWAARSYLRARRWMDLRDRVVVITGADRGLGLILAQQAAAQGAILVLAARKADRLEEAANKVRSHGARAVLAVPTDVSVPEEAARLIARAVQEFGCIDVLINNAGLMLVGAVPTITLDDYRDLMATNFWGAVYTAQAALPHMRARRFGRIANVGSVGGRMVVPHMIPYVASKFALTGFTKALRAEVTRDNIYVTGLYPATIRTGGHTHAQFKGDAQGEYRWFALADSLPGLSMSAETAAARSLKAIQSGDPELILGLSARLGIAFDGVGPNWSSELIALLERGMPAPANLDAPAVRGEALHGVLADFVNKMVPSVARA